MFVGAHNNQRGMEIPCNCCVQLCARISLTRVVFTLPRKYSSCDGCSIWYHYFFNLVQFSRSSPFSAPWSSEEKITNDRYPEQLIFIDSVLWYGITRVACIIQFSRLKLPQVRKENEKKVYIFSNFVLLRLIRKSRVF